MNIRLVTCNQAVIINSLLPEEINLWDISLSQKFVINLGYCSDVYYCYYYYYNCYLPLIINWNCFGSCFGKVI